MMKARRSLPFPLLLLPWGWKRLSEGGSWRTEHWPLASVAFSVQGIKPAIAQRAAVGQSAAFPQASSPLSYGSLELQSAGRQDQEDHGPMKPELEALPSNPHPHTCTGSSYSPTLFSFYRNINLHTPEFVLFSSVESVLGLVQPGASPGWMNSPLCIIFLYCSWQRKGRFSLRRDSPHLAPQWKSPAGLDEEIRAVLPEACADQTELSIYR